ncbi:MAG TPA: BatD family protein [Luteimonas sp.]|jgi:hypothetical protein|nr:BatD family protein [Luteimonas sp.]
MPRLPVRLSTALLLMACAVAAHATTRAWLDRDHIALGETTTLNIQTDQASVDSPDYAPLLADFEVSGNSSSRQFELINGAGSTKLLFAVALQPRRDGALQVPSLRVGRERTQPLALTVSAQAAAPARDGVVFIETQVDAQQPYVQQAVGYTVRLYSATPLLSGQLDQDAPPGASLQRIGEDTQYQRDVGGRRYRVIERHYLLIPERSGTMTIPGARFNGNAASGFFDDLMGEGERDLHAASAPRQVTVRAAPADAAQPWLPLRALQLHYLATPQDVRAGEAATVTVEAIADGATAAQLPELQVSTGSGAQVFADPAQSDDSFDQGRPHVREVRRFSIVPSRPGTLRIQGPRLSWWDVQAGAARTTSLPDLVVQVAPGVAAAGANPTGAATPGSLSPADRKDDGDIAIPGVQGRVRPWALATVAFALLWLGTLAWALQRRGATSPAPPSSDADADAARPAGGATLNDLRRALDRGALADVVDTLCAMARPALADADGLRARLADPRQVAALDALQRARWADGDGVAARDALRAAFKDGPRWRETREAPAKDPLPPLYPR